MITGKTQKIQQRWVNKKTRTEAEQLEKHAAKMNMKPIWGYTKKMRKKIITKITHFARKMEEKQRTKRK